MMRPDAKAQGIYLYPKPVDFRRSINGLAALVVLDIKMEVFKPTLFFSFSTALAPRRAQRLLPLAQAPVGRAFQDQAQCRRRSHRADGRRAKLAARWH
ncbi:IS66 family insertion sequence element accessory protein TnpB [Stutzerimonas nitrititolerans]|uniref:IS66 family insertion sequence element accessory protein TnpB n=1 Tax=Stutzerimonas nitrititolerans TaxID=2482751 RepID=UPI0028AFEC5A|nr:IS66 family insertion sequence element accessory protein TnpB [Stutzerimonas nitrititolerans]